MLSNSTRSRPQPHRAIRLPRPGVLTPDQYGPGSPKPPLHYRPTSRLIRDSLLSIRTVFCRLHRLRSRYAGRSRDPCSLDIPRAGHRCRPLVPVHGPGLGGPSRCLAPTPSPYMGDQRQKHFHCLPEGPRHTWIATCNGPPILATPTTTSPRTCFHTIQVLRQRAQNVVTSKARPRNRSATTYATFSSAPTNPGNTSTFPLAPTQGGLRRAHQPLSRALHSRRFRLRHWCRPLAMALFYRPLSLPPHAVRMAPRLS